MLDSSSPKENLQYAQVEILLITWKVINLGGFSSAKMDSTVNSDKTVAVPVLYVPGFAWRVSGGKGKRPGRN